jgi:cytochrome c-type biogenesis protein CcmH/NrfF
MSGKGTAERVLALLALAALLVPAGALGAAPQTSLQDVEDEVMCPICGTLLELSDSPQARRQKALVARLIAEGRSKEEIKDALVVEYGASVLAVPEAKGFDLTAYLVPVLALGGVVAALALSVLRWRRAGGGGPPAGTPRPPSDADSERLESDLSRYDL